MGNGQKRNEPERGAVASEVMLAVPEGRALGGGRGEREKYTDSRGESGEESDTGPTSWATHFLTQDLRTRMSLEARVLLQADRKQWGLWNPEEYVPQRKGAAAAQCQIAPIWNAGLVSNLIFFPEKPNI